MNFRDIQTLLTQFNSFMFLYMRVVTNQTAPVIVFCRSGRRAGKAKEVLEQMGYTNVLNAGGLNDLRYL